MAGYDIGVSASTANATPQNQSAGTVFNFNSVGTSFDGGSQTATGTPTAVATTKSPGATTDVGNPNSRNPAVSGLGFLTDNPVSTGILTILILAGLGLVVFNQFKKATT